MQVASDPLRGVQIHGPSPDGHGFLPLYARLSAGAYSDWQKRGNQGKGRIEEFEAELLLALPLLLTLHTFDEDEPDATRNHQLTRDASRNRRPL